MENSTFIPLMNGDEMTTQQPQILLNGYVLDSNNDPIIATVTNVSNNGIQTTTDASGFYRILGNIGDILNISANGFKDINITYVQEELPTTTYLSKINDAISLIPPIIFTISLIIFTFLITFNRYYKRIQYTHTKIWISWVTCCVLSWLSVLFSFSIPTGVSIATIIKLVFIGLSITILVFYAKYSKEKRQEQKLRRGRLINIPPGINPNINYIYE